MLCRAYPSPRGRRGARPSLDRQRMTAQEAGGKRMTNRKPAPAHPQTPWFKTGPADVPCGFWQPPGPQSCRAWAATETTPGPHHAARGSVTNGPEASAAAGAARELSTRADLSREPNTALLWHRTPTVDDLQSQRASCKAPDGDPLVRHLNRALLPWALGVGTQRLSG